jgi:hypothetical protein
MNYLSIISHNWRCDIANRRFNDVFILYVTQLLQLYCYTANGNAELGRMWIEVVVAKIHMVVELKEFGLFQRDMSCRICIT